MEIVVGILIFLVCAILILVIMVQNPKGGGLATGFSGANQFGGVAKTNEFLDKATWTLAIALMVLSILSAAVVKKDVVGTQSESEMQNIIETEAPIAPANDPAGLPGAGLEPTPDQ